MKAQVNGITMNYELSGPEGSPPVVLHHPLATNLTIWDELTAALDPRYQVLRMDARGHGQTEAPLGPYMFETLAGDIVALMDHVKFGRAHFLGLSMGGMVGQYLGLLHASRFRSLTLVSTTSCIPDDAKSVWDERETATRAGGMASQLANAMERWVSVEGRKRPELVARLSGMIEKTPVEGYLGWCGAIRDLNISGRLKAITLPTRIIVGEQDPATPVAASQIIHDEITGSDLIIMPAVSHMLCAEDPEAFHGHVLPFLAAHD